MKKNINPVSEETAKKMALEFFESLQFWCAPHKYLKKRGYLCFFGAIGLFIPNSYNEKKDKYPYGYILLHDNTLDADSPFDTQCGKIYYINGVVKIASSAIRYNDAGHTLAYNIESMLAAPNEDIEDPEYHLSEGLRKYLTKLVRNYEKEVKNMKTYLRLKNEK